MRRFGRHPSLVAGLVIALSLGIAGCSNPVRVSSSTEIGDAQGEAAAAKAEKSGKELAASEYANPHFGIGYVLPKGFTSDLLRGTVTSEDEECVFFAYGNAGSHVQVNLVSMIGKYDGVRDAQSWADAYARGLEQSLKGAGESDVVVQVGSATIGESLAAPVVKSCSTKEGGQIVRESFFVADAEVSDEQGGLRIDLVAFDESDLLALEGGLAQYDI